MNQMRIGTQIGSTLIGLSPLGGFTNKRKKYGFFLFIK